MKDERRTCGGRTEAHEKRWNEAHAREALEVTTSSASLALEIRRRPTLPRGRPRSTIGAGGLNFSVRNGKRCDPSAMAAENLTRHMRGKRRAGAGTKRLKTT